MNTTHQFRKLLVATDFSACSIRGLEWAVAVAKRHQATIHLLHIAEFEGWLRVQDKITSSLRFLESRCAEEGVHASSGFEVGPIAATVVNISQEVEADLIVIGARGHTGLKRFFLGSNAEKIVRCAEVPVLVVHPEHELQDGSFERILIATDFSACSRLAAEAGLDFASALAKTPEVTIVHAWQPLIFYGIDAAYTIPITLPDDSRELAREQLAAFAGLFQSRDAHIETVLSAESPPHAIVEEAKARKAGMIVIGTYGASGLERWVSGSVAERVLRHAPCPVLTFRPVQQEARTSMAQERGQRSPHESRSLFG